MRMHKNKCTRKHRTNVHDVYMSNKNIKVKKANEQLWRSLVKLCAAGPKGKKYNSKCLKIM